MNTVERFWSHVEIRGADECWLWTASMDKDGYGQFTVGEGKVRAHRFAYELLVGPIPEELVLDHVRARGCVSRSCVNPTHLEPATQGENVRRGGNWLRQRDRCKNGHPLTEENIRFQGSRRGRICRPCERERQRRYYERVGGTR